MDNKFNVGDIIKSKTKTLLRRANNTPTYVLVTHAYPSALVYKGIYFHDGIEGSLSFKYAHRNYEKVS